jgi:hypothetical protein
LGDIQGFVCQKKSFKILAICFERREANGKEEEFGCFMVVM